MRPWLIASVLAVSCSTSSVAPATPSAAGPSPEPSATASAARPVPTSSGPSPSPIPLPSTAQISAPSANAVWTLVAGSRLFRSSDRGEHWEERPFALGVIGPAYQIAFLNEREGWLLMPGSPATQCTFQSVSLWKTTDAGGSWERLAPQGVGDGQCKEALSLVDAQRGFFSASDPNQPPLVYRSVDGGRSWSASRPLPDPPGFTSRGGGFTLRAGAVRAFGPALLVEAIGNAGGALARYVFTSSDGGASWRYLAAAPGPDAAFAFVTATRWLVVGAPGGSQETTDSGASWHSYASDYRQAAPVAPAITFADERVGYATVRGAIQRTDDGGVHWRDLRTPGT